MSVKSTLAAVALSLAAMGASGTLASAACTIKEIAELPIVMDGNAPLLEFSVNGRSVYFLVDTGSSTTMISRAGAADLGLHVHELIGGGNLYGVGGGDTLGKATIQELKLGKSVVHNFDILVASHGLSARRYVGILGEDFLHRHDLEFDFANGVMRILNPAGCAGDQVVYWRKPYSMADIAPSNNEGDLKGRVLLNGHSVLAEIDTGAYTSVVTTAAAAAAGVTPHSDGVTASNRSRGIGGETVETFVAVFPSFKFGDEEIKNAKLRIADLFAADKEVYLGSRIPTTVDYDLPGMLLGADFLRAHRVYIARSQGKIYFSYNGGAIFQVMGPPRDETAPTVPAAAPPAAAPGAPPAAPGSH